MSDQTLVPIFVTPDEAKARMRKARADAKAAQAEADGLRKFAPKDKRHAKKIAALEELAYLNDRIAISCKAALDELAIGGAQAAEEVEAPEYEIVALDGSSTNENGVAILCVCEGDYTCLACRTPVPVGADVDEEGG